MLTRALVRRRTVRDKMGMQPLPVLAKVTRVALDFALPPRCASCGMIVADPHSFCSDCWKQLEFLTGGCDICGMPLAATDSNLCAPCLAKPPRIARSRAAVAYEEHSRSLALRLKYGRKVALARTMARFMAPLIERTEQDTLLVPVPLHRSRLWRRGFNQAALIARELGRLTGMRVDCEVLERMRRTPPLKGMSPLQRRRTVGGAFRVRRRVDLEGRRIVLIDDVLTTGSTANACARALRRAGAARVDFAAWARVVRPQQI